jgi:hypothetical protein
MADLQYRKISAPAAREIKASAHYSYVANGITLDGTKFATGELVLEGQCLVMDDTSKKYEKAGADLTGKSNPVVLDESVQFKITDAGENPDTTVGQVIDHGAVYESMLANCTAAFKTAVGGRIMFK